MQIDRILGNVGILYVGTYNSSIQYEYLNCVTYNGSSYVCVNQNGVTGVTPGTTDDWQLSAKKGDIGPVGPKPINGIDYNTPEEKEEFKNDVVGKATEEVDKNIANIETEAIENYNKNATQKTTEYNTNANTQVESFNTNATSKTNDFNSNASTKTEEFNAVVDAEKEQFAGQTESINHHIAVVSDELERVKNDVLETGEESGSYITLNDSAMAEYQELSVDGVCEQETTSGKNLLNIENNSISQELTNVAINNHEIKFTTAANSKYEQTIFFKNILLKANKTYSIMRIKSSEVPSTMGQLELYKGSDWIKVILNGTVNSGTFTVSEDDIYLVRLKLSNANQPSYTGTISNIMISEEGGEYEPYTGGQPSPSPDYPQEIKTIENSLKITSCNKNLFDKNDENMFLKGLVPDNSGLILQGETSISKPNYIKTIIMKCKPNTAYSISKLASTTFYIYDSEEIPYVNYQTRLVVGKSNLSNYSFTTSKSAKYILFKFYNTWTNEYYTYDEVLSSVQIEQSSTPTPSEQHLQSQIEANLPKGEFIGKIDDTYKDTLKVEYNEEDGQYHLNLYKNIRKVVLNGSESFNLNTINNYGIANFNYKTGLSSELIDFNTMSNYFKKQITSISNTKTEGIYFQWQSELFLRIESTKASTVEQLKTWLSTHNTEVYYAIATPYVLDLGVVDMPITYNEVTNLFTDSDLMPTINAKYYRNFITTVRNLQVNEKSLKQELIDINNRLSALESATTNVASESEVVE